MLSIFALFFSSVLFPNNSSDNVLKLSTDKNKLHINVKHKNSDSVKYAIPINGAHIFLPSKHPWIKEENDCLLITIKENDFVLNATVDSTANLVINKCYAKDNIIITTTGDVTNKGTLTCGNMRVHSDSFANKGNIICNESTQITASMFVNEKSFVTYRDFTVTTLTNGYQCFVNRSHALIEVGGNFSTKTSTWTNRAGNITVAGDVSIEATEFVNSRQDLTKFAEHVSKECTKNTYSESSPPASLISQKNISITCKTGINEASSIRAHDAIEIHAEKFENKNHFYHNTSCSTKIEHNFIFPDSTIHIPHHTNYYTPASITAGDSIIFVIAGKKYVFTKNKEFKELPGVYNTGYIKAGENIDVSRHGFGQLVNGSAITPYKKPPVLSTRPVTSSRTQLFNKKPRTCIEVDNAPFVYAHHMYDNDYLMQQPSRLGYYNVDNQHLTGKERMLYSEKIQAEKLCEYIEQETGSPFLSSYATAEEQLQGLQEMGFLFAVVNGELSSLKTDVIPEQEKNFTEEERQQAEILVNVMKQPGITIQPRKVFNRITKIKQGTHSATSTSYSQKNQPISLVYYGVEDYKGEKVLVPYVFISEVDRKANNHPEGFMGAKNIRMALDRVFNYGTMIALNEIHIDAHTVINQTPYSKTREVSTDGHTRSYSVITPQPGGNLVGLKVEVKVDSNPLTDSLLGKSGIKNVGGTIFAKHEVSLIAGSGNIENCAFHLGTQIVRWDRTSLHKAFTNKKASMKKSFKAGTIRSEGDIHIDAEAGHVINEAAQIIGGGNVNINGYLGVVLEGLFAKKKYAHETKISGMGVETLQHEGAAFQESLVSSNKDANITSGGKIKGRGSRVEAQHDINVHAANGNDFGTKTTQLKETRTWTGSTGFALQHVTSTTTHDVVAQSTFESGGKTILDSDVDNELEAVIFHSGTVIHVRAKRDNIFKGKEQTTTVDTDSFSFGVSFFGSDALQNFAQGRGIDGAWALVNEDPLLKSLLLLGDSKSATEGIANGTLFGIQTWRALCQYQQASKNNTKLSTGLLERLNLIDGQGNFNPGITFRFGHESDHEKHTRTLKAETNSPAWINESGRDSHVLDGTETTAKKAKHKVGRNMYTSPAKEEYSHSTQQEGFFVGTNGATHWIGVDVRRTKQTKITYENGQLTKGNLKMEIGGNFHQKGYVINGDNIELIINGSHIIESVQNHEHSQTNGFGATASTSGAVSGSFTAHEHDKKTVQSPASITARKKLVHKVKKNLKLVGAYLNGPKGSSFVEAKGLLFEDIVSKERQRGFGFGAEYAHGDTSGIPGFADIGYQNKGEKEIARATVSRTIDLSVENNISGLNRDTSKMQEVIDEEGPEFRLVVPIISPTKFAQNAQEIKRLFSTKTEDPVADFDNKKKKILETFEEQKEEAFENLVNEADTEGQMLQQEQQKQQEEDEDPEIIDFDEVQNNQDKESEKESDQAQAPRLEKQQESAHKNEPIEDLCVQSDDPKNNNIGIFEETLVTEDGHNVEVELIQGGDEITLDRLCTSEEFLTSLKQTSVTQDTNGNVVVIVQGDKADIKIALSQLAYNQLSDQVRHLIAQTRASSPVEDVLNHEPELWQIIASIALDLTPAGSPKMFAEAILAHDLITNEELSIWGRAFRLGFAMFPLVKNVRYIGPAIKCVGGGCQKVLTGVWKATGEKVIRRTSQASKVFSSKIISWLEQRQFNKIIKAAGLQDLGNGTWKSPGGLIYGKDTEYINKIKHVLSHTTNNVAKGPQHTVFNVPKDQVLQLIDSAWLKRGAPLPTNPMVYEIPMNMVIGTNGETTIKIVVREGTRKILTAYPIK